MRSVSAAGVNLEASLLGPSVIQACPTKIHSDQLSTTRTTTAKHHDRGEVATASMLTPNLKFSHMASSENHGQHTKIQWLSMVKNYVKIVYVSLLKLQFWNILGYAAPFSSPPMLDHTKRSTHHLNTKQLLKRSTQSNYIKLLYEVHMLRQEVAPGWQSAEEHAHQPYLASFIHLIGGGSASGWRLNDFCWVPLLLINQWQKWKRTSMLCMFFLSFL